ncbi:MAG: cytochrome c3 family protein [Deltaproteobacteria bacterium]|nr:cytochrome c3 family protein [Deltaproteobacteria bacterium]
MEIKTEKIVAYWIAIALFVIGFVCYAAFPDKTPEEPVRIMLTSTAGNVLFDHKTHLSEDGYGIDCVDCHHAWEEDSGERPLACGECHERESEEEDMVKRADAFHNQCLTCHEEDGTAPMDCSLCHVL